MDTLEILKSLSDETRIRIFFVLLYEPLCVNDVIEILQMGQSRISRHLKILMDSQILTAVRSGAKIYYGISPEFRLHPLYDAILQTKENGKNLNLWNKNLWEYLKKDQLRTFDFLTKRKNESIEFFDQFGDLLESTQNEYVDSHFYRKKLLSLVPKDIKIAMEAGCGTGWVSVELVKKIKEKLICVDQSSLSLSKAKEKFRAQNLLGKVEFLTSEMEKLPLKNESVDLVVYSMALHHTPNVLIALKEAHRVLKPGGKILIADLEHHNVEDMRKKYADFWLGFYPEDLKNTLLSLNFRQVQSYKGKGKGKLTCIFFKAKKS
ncbi:MAG: metalloregulator ArsR/SmtB family transcription factor [Leptospiraceae bacterium]|nr:metalloregulator ArsR/SmtB family transcription factor [Leptospiraceae bacterium]MDW7976431.1 metalloregulator ArsR/SmtB family transcription factor [Leptospiraceae bacterium]